MPPLGSAKIPAGAGELFFNAGNVKTVGVESGKVASFEERKDVGGGFRERRTILDYVVRYSVNCSRLRRNRDRGIEKPGFRLFRSIRVYLHRRKFDYAVLTGGHPGGLYVEHDKRTVKFKFKCHYLLFSRISGAGGLL